MTAPEEVPDHWTFYVATMEDAPASIALNLWYLEHGAEAGADTLYLCNVAMLEPGPHGLGEQEEGDSFSPLEDKIRDTVAGSPLFFVGRVRTQGVWQLSFYGPASAERTIQRALGATVSGTGREFEIVTRRDPEWSYYFEFLRPSPEQFQWIRNQQVVQALEDRGDTLENPRRVDHWAYFPRREDRDKFTTTAQELGFHVQPEPEDPAPAEGAADDVRRKASRPAPDDAGAAASDAASDVASDEVPGERSDDAADDEPSFCAHVFRVDSVQLRDIHRTVLELSRLAQLHGGEYDGWETFVDRT